MFIKLKTGEIYESNGMTDVMFDDGSRHPFYLVSQYRLVVNAEDVEKVSETLEGLEDNTEHRKEVLDKFDWL
jgi:hypothetical protein